MERHNELQTVPIRRAASYLGIEGGASRTTVLLSPGGGLSPLRGEFGPANLRLMDDGGLVGHFAAINSLCQRVAAPLAGVAIGLAGVRTQSDRLRIRAAAAKVWPNVPCYATNDLETALAAAEPRAKPQAAARVLILSGTGSCCYGRTRDNQTARFGGWGHILGDKGSGYEIGLRALQAAVYHLDRDGQWSLLGCNLFQSLLLNEPEDLIDWAGTASKPDIAALAVRVFDAAAAGDKIARDILEAAGGIPGRRRRPVRGQTGPAGRAGPVHSGRKPAVAAANLCRQRARPPAQSPSRRDRRNLAPGKRLGRAGTGPGTFRKRPRP